MSRRPKVEDLSDADVFEIRVLAGSGVTYAEIGRRYDRGISTVSKIARGLVRADVGGPIQPPRRGGRPRGASGGTVPTHVRVAILATIRGGSTRPAAAREHGVSERTVGRVIASDRMRAIVLAMAEGGVR